MGVGPNDWACTYDSNTKLIWEVKTNDSGLHDKKWRYILSGTRDPVNLLIAGEVGSTTNCKTSDRCDTEKFTQDVNTQGLCGYKTWRVPLVEELKTLLVCSAGKSPDSWCYEESSNPRIDSVYFPNTEPVWFWSTNPHSYVAHYSLDVLEKNGYNTTLNNSNAFQVRLVLNGQSFTVDNPKPIQALSAQIASGSFVEPNDTAEQATPILVNDKPVYQLFDGSQDEDWFEFYAIKGTRYSIQIPPNSVGKDINPALSLYDAQGTALTGEFNAGSFGQGEEVSGAAPYTGLFRIRIRNKAALSRSAVNDVAYQFRVYLTDLPQQGLLKGSVLNSCSHAGISKAEVSAWLGGGVSDATLTHKTGEFGLLLNPDNYDLKSFATNYQELSKPVTVNQINENIVQFEQPPTVSCANYIPPPVDPVLLQQQAVAVYDTQAKVLIVRYIIAGDKVYYAELSDSGNQQFTILRALEIPGVSDKPAAEYSFSSLVANLPTVFMNNKSYKWQIKNNGNGVFSIEKQEVLQ